VAFLVISHYIATMCARSVITERLWAPIVSAPPAYVPAWKLYPSRAQNHCSSMTMGYYFKTGLENIHVCVATWLLHLLHEPLVEFLQKNIVIL